MVRLGEIMVVARHPEDGDHGGAPPFPLQAAGKGEARERFVDRVERAGEQPGLLAGRHGEDGGLGQPLARRTRQRRGNHLRRHPSRRNVALGQGERRDRRRSNPWHHDSRIPLPAPRVSENTSA